MEVIKPFLKLQTDIKIEDRGPEFEGRLIDLSRRIARISNAIEKTDEPGLIVRLAELQTARKALQAQIESEKIKVKGATDTNGAYHELVKNLDKKIEDNAFRLSLRTFLRGVIKKIVIGRGEDKNPFYTIHFLNTSDTISIDWEKNSEKFTAFYWETSETYKFRKCGNESKLLRWHKCKLSIISVHGY